MLKQIFTAAIVLVLTVALGAAVLAPEVSAIDVFDACSGNSSAEICKARSNDNALSLVKNVISILLWLIGIVAVIMIVIGGFKFVTSNGDSNSIQSAKNTVLYAVIGLVVAIVGQAVVLFVINWF